MPELRPLPSPHSPSLVSHGGPSGFDEVLKAIFNIKLGQHWCITLEDTRLVLKFWQDWIKCRSFYNVAWLLQTSLFRISWPLPDKNQISLNEWIQNVRSNSHFWPQLIAILSTSFQKICLLHQGKLSSWKNIIQWPWMFPATFSDINQEFFFSLTIS